MNRRIKNRMLRRFYRQHGAARYYYAMRRNKRRKYQGTDILTGLINVLIAVAVIVAIAIW